MIAFSNFKCMKYPMISADLMIDKTSSSSSMCTGSKICLYPSTTSIGRQYQQRSPYPEILPLAVMPSELIRRSIVH